METTNNGLVLLQITAIVNWSYKILITICFSCSSILNTVILMLHLHFACERSFFYTSFLKRQQNHLKYPAKFQSCYDVLSNRALSWRQENVCDIFSQPHKCYWFWFSWVWNLCYCETDHIFRCCKDHDECYGRIMKDPHLCSFSSAVYWKIYTRDDTCTGCGKFECFVK